MVSRDTAADGKALVSQLAGSGASVMQATPTTWRMLIDAGWHGEARNFKIICGGESLPLKLAQELLARSGSVWNLYGPTETTVWSAIWPVTPGCDKIAIGRPIHNTQIHILDATLQPMPVGMVGEVYSGGEGLARGYLNRPDLTAEKFLPNPFGQPSSRLYRTGDLGRRWPDGNVEFIGRVDNQVKMRGFRIELGEIEAVLCGHEDVKEAVVAVREGDQLAGYVLARAGRLVDVNELRDYLRRKLPAYMVPSALMSLDNLPLTPNGKIDRHALPMVESDILAKDARTNPTDRLEFELTHLWKKCLQRTAVSLDDNFFDLGGDSLRAVSLLAQIEKRFGKAVRLVEFLADATVTGVASLLRQRGCAMQWFSLFPIRICGSKPPLFWVHGDGSNYLLPAYLEDRPLYGFMHQSQDGTPARYTTVEEIATCYLQDLCSVQPEGPYFLGGYSFGGLVAFEMAQQLRRRGEEIGLLALLEATNPGAVRADTAKQKINAPLETEITCGATRRHLANLHALTSTEQIALFAGKIRMFVERLSGIPQLKRAGKRAAYRFCERSGRTMPLWVRRAYLIDIYRQAARRYAPGVYPGRVVFFKATHNAHDHRTAWRRLVSGEFNFQNIPGDHASVLEDSQLRLWADKLNECLDKIETPQSTEVIETR
jgi:thioesterase domain-containing protein/acyl carrier protein